MAISLYSTTTDHVNGSSRTISCDLSNNAYRFCVVAVADTWSGQPTSVTCGGDSMSNEIYWDQGGMAASIWILKAHKTGTQDIVVTFASACNSIITVLSLKNVDQTTPVRATSDKVYGTDTSNPTYTRNSLTAGDWFIGSLSWNGDYGNVTMAASATGQVEKHNYNYTTGYAAGACSYVIVTGTSGTLTWTRSGTSGQEWSLPAIAVIPAAGVSDRRKHFVS